MHALQEMCEKTEEYERSLSKLPFDAWYSLHTLKNNLIYDPEIEWRKSGSKLSLKNWLEVELQRIKNDYRF